MKHNNWKSTAVIFVLCAAVVIGCFVIVGQLDKPDEDILRNGETASAQPTGEWRRGIFKNGLPAFYLQYEFNVNGRKYEVFGERRYKSKEDVQKVLKMFDDIESSVEVKYNPSDPTESVVVIDTELSVK